MSQDELRDWYAYFLWNNVHLLRSLKVELTPVQQKLVEECSKRYAATVREDTQKAVTEARIDELSKALDVYNHLEEYNADPPQNLKPGNHYILDRIATLTNQPPASPLET